MDHSEKIQELIVTILSNLEFQDVNPYLVLIFNLTGQYIYSIKLS
jgi:hypothetical protein